jgi:DNA-binding NtrC family response regulator
MNHLEYVMILNEFKKKNKVDIDFLIYDDYSMNSYILEKLLLQINKKYVIKTASTMNQLYEILKKNNPKCFFVDLMVGTKMSGIHLFNDLQSIDKKKLLIPYSGLEKKMIIQELGEIPILEKPINIMSLKKIITDYNL